MGLYERLLGIGEQVDPAELSARLDGVLLDNEDVGLAYKVVRDFFVFTNRRLILVNIQGVTGSKVEYMTVPYKSIVRFAVETAGTFDLDAELKIWVASTPEPIKRLLKKGTDVRGIQRALTAAVLT